MDETLAEVALDLSGRAFLSYHAPERVEAIGGVNRFSYQLVEEFLRAFASSLLCHPACGDPPRPRCPPHGRGDLSRGWPARLTCRHPASTRA
jgi:hypothetical protein